MTINTKRHHILFLKYYWRIPGSIRKQLALTVIKHMKTKEGRIFLDYAASRFDYPQKQIAKIPITDFVVILFYKEPDALVIAEKREKKKKRKQLHKQSQTGHQYDLKGESHKKVFKHGMEAFHHPIKHEKIIIPKSCQPHIHIIYTAMRG